MSSEKATAIVLRAVEFSETSSVVTLFVSDTMPPVLSLPSNITATRDSAGGSPRAAGGLEP